MPRSCPRRSARSAGSIVNIKPLGTTAFRSEESGTRRPGKQNLRPVGSEAELNSARLARQPLVHRKNLFPLLLPDTLSGLSRGAPLAMPGTASDGNERNQKSESPSTDAKLF
jgi:hypothetical protein